jgi:hypothetical protein
VGFEKELRGRLVRHPDWRAGRCATLTSLVQRQLLVVIQRRVGIAEATENGISVRGSGVMSSNIREIQQRQSADAARMPERLIFNSTPIGVDLSRPSIAVVCGVVGEIC